MSYLYQTDELMKLIYETLAGFCEQYAIPLLYLDLAIMLVAVGIIAGFVSVSVMFMVWLERKVSAHMQDRLGPMRVGPHGALQTIADAIKLLFKERITPQKADKWVYTLAPVVIFASAMAAYVVIPWSPGMIIADLNIGLLYLLAIGSVAVIGLLMAGWGSNNKYSLLSAFRCGAQIISYEVAATLSCLGVIMLTGSLSMVDIVNAQKDMGWPFIVVQPIGFLIYLIAGTAEVNRAPFDLAEAESELIAGFHTEYSAMGFSMFFLAEYANMFIVSAIAATLFLGGWAGPVLPPVVWFLLKTFGLVFVFMWFRWTFPRIRVDQLMVFGWKFLIPLAFVNLLVTGIVMLL
ncbi:MAG: NADH-quinone oxidoreductase subunit NuoH [bacterium]|nr:NADH-quinone oxidoreductase subunit NuoH [bacterium]